MQARCRNPVSTRCRMTLRRCLLVVDELESLVSRTPGSGDADTSVLHGSGGVRGYRPPAACGRTGRGALCAQAVIVNLGPSSPFGAACAAGAIAGVAAAIFAIARSPLRRSLPTSILGFAVGTLFPGTVLITGHLLGTHSFVGIAPFGVWSACLLVGVLVVFVFDDRTGGRLAAVFKGGED
jgi:hypothetical protein